MTPNGMLLDVYVRVSPKEKKKKRYNKLGTQGMCSTLDMPLVVSAFFNKFCNQY
jgi:hypothetical protein